jgi:hypothetical protein
MHTCLYRTLPHNCFLSKLWAQTLCSVRAAVQNANAQQGLVHYPLPDALPAKSPNRTTVSCVQHVLCASGSVSSPSFYVGDHCHVMRSVCS